MAMRTLVHAGRSWTIWDVVPALGDRLQNGSRPITVGWLCFQCPDEKRRIVPAPPGWEEWPDERLAECLTAADVVPHTGTFRSPH